MTKEELLEALKEIYKNEGDKEMAHVRADNSLLEYINDEDITNAYEEIEKWYA